MLLYYAPGTCALACWIALEWAGAEYATERVDPKSDAYRAVNPLGMVPALAMGEGHPRTQADAILQYIAERYPARELGAEAGEAARFEFNETMAFLTGDFHPAFWPYFTPDRFTTDQSAAALDAVKASVKPRVDRVLAHLDGLIGESVHVYRARRSVADAYAFVMTRWSAKLTGNWTDFPNVARFMAATADDPAVQRVLEASQA